MKRRFVADRGQVTAPGLLKRPVICQLADYSAEYSGTFVDSILCLARNCWEKLRVETYCIFPEATKDRQWLKLFDQAGVLYGFVPGRRNIVKNVRWLLRDYEPLIFHTHFSLFDLSPIALRMTSFKQAKIVWHYHNPTESTLRQRIKDAIKMQLLGHRWVDRCIAVGDGVLHSLIRVGLPREKLVLIYNGVNTLRFLSEDKTRRAVRQALGVMEDQTVFLLLGWQPHRKGVDIFLKAAAEVIRNGNSNNLFILVGRKETRDFVGQQVASSYISESFLKIIDPLENFSSLLNGIDALVSCSRSEGLSYSVFEAMAAERLVLSSDIPGVQDTYGQAKGVWLYPTENWQRLAELMKNIQRMSPVERESLGRANAQHVQYYYSLEAWSQKMVNTYSCMLGR